MMKHIALVMILLVCLVISDINNVIMLDSNQVREVDIPGDSYNVNVSIISKYNTSFSAYLVDYSDYINDSQFGNFSNDDNFKNKCIDVTVCNDKVGIDYRINYVLVIQNNNEPNQIEYTIINENYSLLRWAISFSTTLGAIIAIVFIVFVVTYCIKYKKR